MDGGGGGGPRKGQGGGVVVGKTRIHSGRQKFPRQLKVGYETS